MDDNPSNLAEAKTAVPGLNVADPSLIARMLTDPAFAGKDDPDLARLTQYKLLEQRAVDAADTGGDGDAFLRASGIEVRIVTDVELHIDRAVELVNRTSQLNFTKRRLPADPAAAREQLLREIGLFHAQAALVSVRDRYGEYGLCGFYMTAGVLRDVRLEYFCFSCRIRGMEVETWLFDRLGRPTITIAGEVLTDLHAPRDIDWINASSGEGAVHDTLDETVPEIVLRGGCELDSVAHYCRLISSNVTAETNRLEWRAFLKYNTSTNLLLTLDPPWDPDAEEELRRVGFMPEDRRTRLWDLPAGGVGMFCGWADFYADRYRHKRHGFTLAFEIQHLRSDWMTVDEAAFAAFVDRTGATGQAIENVRKFIAHIGQNYDSLPQALSPEERRDHYRRIFDRFSQAATLYMLLPHERGVREIDRAFFERPEAIAYNEDIKALARDRVNIHVIEVGKFVRGIEDCQLLVDHFHRTIYFNIFEEVVADLKARTSR